MELKWRSEWTTPSLVGGICFGIGVAVGYTVSSRRNRSIIRIQDIKDREPAEVETIVQETVVEETTEVIIPGEEPETIVLEFGDDVREQGKAFLRELDPQIAGSHFVIEEDGEIIQNLSVLPEPERVSVFSDVDETWNYEAEMKTRTPDKPYIIHRDEYYNEESGYGHSTLTYYAGDDVLVDEEDVPIYNAPQVASPLIFGKGSGDPSIVHIRNDRLEAEYEVIFDRGHYATEVLGIQSEAELSREKPIVHKFRQD